MHHDLGIFSFKRCEHYFSQPETFTSNVQFWLPLSEGWGASCPGWFILPPTKDLGQTVSSVNSYCTIILEYLVVRDVNIISAKLRCLHPTFSLVILVRGMGGKLQNIGKQKEQLKQLVKPLPIHRCQMVTKCIVDVWILAVCF